MKNIYIFILLILIIDGYLLQSTDIINLPLDNEYKILFITINVIGIIYVLHQLYIYNIITPDIIKNSFTNSPSNTSYTLDLSTNPMLTSTSDKIIYWIVNNENGNYNNFNSNGLVNIQDKKAHINLDNLESFNNVELKYRIIDNEKISDIFSQKLPLDNLI